MIVLIAILFIALLGFFIGTTCLLEGWVASKLWAWFVIPQFHLAPLPITIAIGLSFLVGVYRHTAMPDMKKKESDWKPLALIYAKLLFLLILGWIVTLFM